MSSPKLFERIMVLSLILTLAVPTPLLLAQEGEVAPQEEAVPEAEAPTEEAADETTTEKGAPAEEAAEEAEELVAEPEGAFTSFGEVPADQAIVASSLGLDEKVSLDLRNIEVADALRFLAQKGGLNMVLSKDVKGRVQLLLNNVPIRDILHLVLITNQLAYETRGDIYYIMSELEFKERYGRKFSDARQVKVFRLKYAVPDQAFSLFEVLKSEIGRLLVDPETGTVLVMDAPENIVRMEQALAGLEQRRSVKVYSLKYAKASEVETRLRSQLDDKKVGLIKSDERTNQIIVETLPDRMTEIEEMILKLDQKTREVLIDSKIVRVVLTDTLEAELRWEGFWSQFSANGENFLSNHPFSPIFRTGQSFVDNFVKITPTTRPTAGSKNELSENLFFGVTGENSFEFLLNFLKTLGEVRVLSNPKLATINNQEARIHVGEKQAYVTTTTTTGQSTATTAETVTFLDIGIKLNVTPTINEDGFVTMKIKPEVSSITDTLTTPSGNEIPIVDTSTAETTVMVKDGVSIIIGGLRKEEKTHARRKVPFLGDIPILGLPFNSYSDETIHTEVLIVITPHIVYGETLQVDEGRPVGKSPFMTYSDYEDNGKDVPVPGNGAGSAVLAGVGEAFPVELKPMGPTVNSQQDIQVTS